MEKIKGNWFYNGLAMFSMFFGAGNVIFPLIVGRHVEGRIPFALIGLFLTAVLVPFSGLMSITLFQGDYVRFFKRTGRVTGAFITVLVLALIGPFAGIPRCITLTYSTLNVYFPGLSLIIFSAISCCVILLCCIRKQKILDLLGYVLTPLLLCFLGIFIIKGILTPTPPTEFPIGDLEAFKYGLIEGYNTMDLLAAFFFSSIICLKLKNDNIGHASPNAISIHLLKASLVGAVLLGLVYVGFGFVSSVFSGDLQGVESDQLLGAVGGVVLGPIAGIVVSFTVALSCLTTAIALSLVSSDFIQNYLFGGKVNYIYCLIGVLIVTFCISTLKFNGIVKLIFPILNVCYPALLMLSILNLAYKLFDFKPVKLPFFVVLLIALINSLI